MSLQRDGGGHVRSHHEALQQRMLEEGRKIAERTLLELAHRKHMRMQTRSVLDVERVLPLVSVDKLPPRSAQEAYDIVRQPTTVRVLSERRAFAIRDRAARIAAGLVAPDAVHEEDYASDGEKEKDEEEKKDVVQRDVGTSGGGGGGGGDSDGVGGQAASGKTLHDAADDGEDEDARRKRRAGEVERERKRKKRERELRLEAEYRRRDLLRDNTQRRLARAAALRRRRVPKIIGEAHPAWSVLWRHVHVERRNLYLDGVSTCGKTDLALELFRLLQTAAAQNFATRRRDGGPDSAASSLSGTLTLLNSSAAAAAASLSSSSSSFAGGAIAVVPFGGGTAPSANPPQKTKRPSTQQLTRDAHRTVAFVTGASYVAADFLRALAVQRRIASEQRHEIRQRQVYDAVNITTKRSRPGDAAPHGTKRNAPSGERVEQQQQQQQRRPTLYKRPRLSAARSRDGHDPKSQPERDADEADEEEQNREAEQWWLGERTRAASQPARGSERWWRMRQRQQTRPGDQRRRRKTLLDTHLFASWTSLLANITPGQFSAAVAAAPSAAPSAAATVPAEQKMSGARMVTAAAAAAASSESARADYARKYLEEQRLQTVQRLTLELMIARPSARPFFAARVWVVDDLHLVPNADFVALDVVARVVRGRPDLPFGGIQLVALGDLRRARGRVPRSPRAPDGGDGGDADPERLFELPQWTHLFPAGCAHRLEGDDLLAEIHRVDDTTLTFVAECVRPVDRSASSSATAAAAAPTDFSLQPSNSLLFPTLSSSSPSSSVSLTPPLGSPDASLVSAHDDARRPLRDGEFASAEGARDGDRDDAETDGPRRASTYEQEALERERAVERLVTIVVTETDAEATLFNDEANLALVCKHRQKSGAGGGNRSRQLLVEFEAADEHEAIAARQQRTQQRATKRNENSNGVDAKGGGGDGDDANRATDEDETERVEVAPAAAERKEEEREWKNSELYDADEDDGEDDGDTGTDPGDSDRRHRAREKSKNGRDGDGDGDEKNLDPDEIRRQNELERRERLARWSCENLVRARGGAAEFEVVTLAFDAIVQLTRSVVRHGKVYYAGALGRVFWRRDDTPYVKFTGYRRPLHLKPLPAVADVSGAPPINGIGGSAAGGGGGIGNIRAARKYQLPLRRAAALSVAQLAGLPVRKPWRLDTSRLTNARSLYDALSRVKESRRAEFTLERLRARLVALAPLDLKTGAYCDSLPAYLFPEVAAPQTLSQALVSASSFSLGRQNFTGQPSSPSPPLASPPASPLSLTSLLASPLAIMAPPLPTVPTLSATPSTPLPLASPPRLVSSSFSPSLFFSSSSSSSSSSLSSSASQNSNAPLCGAASPPPLLRTTSLGPLPSASRTGSVRVSSFSQ